MEAFHIPSSSTAYLYFAQPSVSQKVCMHVFLSRVNIFLKKKYIYILSHYILEMRETATADFPVPTTVAFQNRSSVTGSHFYMLVIR